MKKVLLYGMTPEYMKRTIVGLRKSGYEPLGVFAQNSVIEQVSLHSYDFMILGSDLENVERDKLKLAVVRRSRNLNISIQDSYN